MGVPSRPALRGAAEEPINSRSKGSTTLGLPPAHPTMPSLLRAAGYRTALIGKWHLGYPPAFGPLKSGYEEFFGPMSGGVDYFTHCSSNGSHDLFLGEAERQEDGYLTDLISRRAVDFVERRGIRTGTVEQVLELWGRTLDAIEAEDLDRIGTEIDWVMKYKLIERYRAKPNMTMSHPRVAQIDLAYHDIHRRRGLYYLLERKGQATRICNDLKIFEGKSVPPQTTRARLRGDFIRRAQEQRRDFTVDWVHLKLNDQAQRTVLCKDPFRSVDDRVEKLIAGM